MATTTRPKEHASLGKEKKPSPSSTTKRCSSITSTNPKPSINKSSTTSSSSGGAPPHPELKNVPNYLKPTASSRPESFKYVKKNTATTTTSSDQDSHHQQKPSLNRRRSFDRPPSPSRLRKAFVSPESGRDRSLRSSSSFSYASNKTAPAAASKSLKPGQPLVLKSNLKKSINSSPSAYKQKYVAKNTTATSKQDDEYDHHSQPDHDQVIAGVVSDQDEHSMDDEDGKISNGTTTDHDHDQILMNDDRSSTATAHDISIVSEELKSKDTSPVASQIIDQQTLVVPVHDHDDITGAVEPQNDIHEEEKFVEVNNGNTEGHPDGEYHDLVSVDDHIKEEKVDNKVEDHEHNANAVVMNDREKEKEEEEEKMEKVEENEVAVDNKEEEELIKEVGNENDGGQVEATEEADVDGQAVADQAVVVQPMSTKRQARGGTSQGGSSKKDNQQAYNDVIEETASKLLEKRKNKVKALVGAFETVIDYESSSR